MFSHLQPSHLRLSYVKLLGKLRLRQMVFNPVADDS